MDDNLEIREIREAQRILQAKLDILQQRIDRMEERKSAVQVPKAVEKTEAPSPEFVPIPVERAEPPPLPIFKPVLPTSAFPQCEADPFPEVSVENKATATKNTDSLELRVGRVWLVRIGIVILLTGLVFLGNFAWTEFIAKLGAFGKLALIYLSGFGLGACGWLVQRKRKELSAYGKVLIGGGIATVYYATYAAHFVEPLRVIANPLTGGVLLLLLAVGIIWLADRIRSQGVAAATIVLGFYTGAINPISGFSLFSNLVLCALGITLLLRRKWLSVSFLSLIGCYAAFAFWRLHATGSIFVVQAPDAQTFWSAFLFPACYWVVFTAATFLGRSGTFAAGTRSAFITINNGAFFGLVAPLVAGTYRNELWIFVLGYGAVLLVLFAMASRLNSKEAFGGFYLTQGLTLVLLGIYFKFSGYQLAIILALQSATLLKLSSWRHNVIFQIFSAISACVATAVAMGSLQQLELEPYAGITAQGVALILVGMAWLLKRQRGYLHPLSFQWRAAGLLALATVLGLTAAFQCTEGYITLYVLVGVAVLALAGSHGLRVPELIPAAHVFLGAALCYWLVRPLRAHAPAVPFAVIGLALLAFHHWWQHQKLFPLGVLRRQVGEAIHALALVGVLFVWTFAMKFFGFSEQVVLALYGLGWLAYAFLTRGWPLAICSQIFSAYAVIFFLKTLKIESWQIGVCTLLVLAAQSQVCEMLGHRASVSAIAGLRTYSKVLRGVAGLMGLLLIGVHVPQEWQFVAFGAAAVGLFGAALYLKKGEPLVYAGIAIVSGYWQFLINQASGPVFLPDFAVLFLILIAQQVGRNVFQERTIFPRMLQAMLIIAGVCGIWLLCGRLVSEVQNGLLLTASWGVLAALVLSLGFLLRERTYRWLGLGILTVALGRLFLVDVWQLETIFRIFSFLLLGVVLMVLGFFYNRFADRIRKWL